LSFAMDMTHLLTDLNKSPLDFVQEFIGNFARDVADRLQRNM